MEIWLIRHGNPDYANDDLTQIGHTEARLLADYMTHAQLDTLYVSPLGRAQRTCSYTAEALGAKPITLDWLEETLVARGDQCLWEAPGEMFLSNQTLPTLDDWRTASGCMPEGDAQFNRVGSGFDELLESYGYVRHGNAYRVENVSDQRIAMFCHKGIILTLLSYLLNWAMPMIYISLEIPTTAITRLKMIESSGTAHAKVYTVNDLAHLQAMETPLDSIQQLAVGH